MLKNICAPAHHFFQKPNFAPFRLCVELLFLFFFPPSLSLSLLPFLGLFDICFTADLYPWLPFFLHFICCVFFCFLFFVPLSRPKHVSAAAVAIRFVSYLPPFFCLRYPHAEKAEHMFPKLSSLCACVCVCVLINWFRFGSWSCGLAGLLVCALVWPDWWVLGTDCGLWAIIKAA